MEFNNSGQVYCQICLSCLPILRLECLGGQMKNCLEPTCCSAGSHLLMATASGKLLTNEERFQRKMTHDPGCTICVSHHVPESIDHVFRDCSFSATVWRKIPPADTFQEFSKFGTNDWLLNILKSPSLDTSWKIGISVIYWKLWEARNLRIITNDAPTVVSFLIRIHAIVKCHN